VAERNLGLNPPEVANRLYNLANLYSHQGQFVQPEPLFKLSVAIYENVFRPNHPKVTSSRKDLADFYRKTGRIKKAEALEDKLAASHHNGFSPENGTTK
jgi:tetratricopeptide (TPR) repeat protein